MADDFRPESLLHFEDFLCFPFGQTGDRNAGLLRYDIGNVFFIDDGLMFIFMRFPVVLGLLQLFVQVFFRVAQLGGPFILLVGDRLFLCDSRLFDFPFELGQMSRLVHHGNARLRPRLVEKVDRLVGKETTRDIAV